MNVRAWRRSAKACFVFSAVDTLSDRPNASSTRRSASQTRGQRARNATR